MLGWLPSPKFHISQINAKIETSRIDATSEDSRIANHYSEVRRDDYPRPIARQIKASKTPVTPRPDPLSARGRREEGAAP